MQITSILDLLDSYPNPIPAWSIPYFDWCNWVTVVMPESWLNTCEDVQACIDREFIMSILNLDSSLSVNNWTLHINETWVNSVINVVWNAPNITIGGTTIDLSNLLEQFALTFSDWSNSVTVTHNWLVELVGLDWMRFLASAPNMLQVGLPTWAAHMQVLTRDAENNVAFWNNNQCCAQTLSFDTETNILSISGTNAVDLTSINTDNQELIINWNILSITQLNSAPQSVDLTNVNEHTLTLVWNILNIHGSDNVINNNVDLVRVWPKTLEFDNVSKVLRLLDDNWQIVSDISIERVNNQTLEISQTWDQCSDWWIKIGITQPGWQATQFINIPKAPVQCCADVMACQGIQQMLSDIANLRTVAASLQTQITTINQQLP